LAAGIRQSFVKPIDIQSPADNASLALYAKLVVCLTFVLIFIGGQTTTSGAGMAFADWPLSHGSLNPEGWWSNFMMRLEHGHRLTAGLVATLVTIQFIWVTRKRRDLPGKAFPLALWALAGVLAQAVLGGLRVILDTKGIAAAGSESVATVFRVLHGCCAQVELCLLVALAALLSPVWRRLAPQPAWRSIGRFAWITAAVIFLQLIVGATMRHLGAGLAIPTFPFTPGGSFMPQTHNLYVDLNFTHTRFGAALVTVFIVLLSVKTLSGAGGEARLARPALGLCLLLACQVLLGMFVIWKMRPPILTTIHVVNGAAILATTVLLAVRASRGAGQDADGRWASRRRIEEAVA
jgi:cytochrome c oxidase assembly protein subunit 15